MNLLHENPNSGIKHFCVDDVAEIDKLPRKGVVGQDNLRTVKSTAEGSTCKVIGSGEMYMLNSQNVWTKTSSGGGGGGEPEWDYVTEEDVDELFK